LHHILYLASMLCLLHENCYTAQLEIMLQLGNMLFQA